MLTTPLTIDELYQIFTENLINRSQGKITKVTPHSGTDAVAFGCAKIGQKAMKDIALIETHLFVDSASGSYLDQIAERNGIALRYGSSPSTVWVRLVGDVGTTYIVGVNTCTSKSGKIFNFEENVTIGVHGFTYAKVVCTTEGSETNIDPLSINAISPAPVGHQYVVNETSAYGGRDVESDMLFRIRIREGVNLCARYTLSYLEQVFMSINNNVLRVFYQGVTNDGKLKLSVCTQNGNDLTSSELTDLLSKSSQYLSLSELSPYSYNTIGVVLENCQWEYVDLDFRCELNAGADNSTVRKDICVKISSYLDFRYWDYSKRVEWDNILQIVKSVKNMKYVLDEYFYPSADIAVPPTKLPRLRSFVMRDSSGNIIEDVSGTLSPVYYQNYEDVNYIRTILKSL